MRIQPIRVWSMSLGTVAGLFGAGGVGLAAAGAHMSGNPAVTTSAYFLLFHAAALLGLCAIAATTATRSVLWAGGLIAFGTLLFSGDLALRALAGITLVHMAAPSGGILMILGWLGAAIAVPIAFGSLGQRL